MDVLRISCTVLYFAKASGLAQKITQWLYRVRTEIFCNTVPGFLFRNIFFVLALKIMCYNVILACVILALLSVIELCLMVDLLCFRLCLTVTVTSQL